MYAERPRFGALGSVGRVSMRRRGEEEMEGLLGTRTLLLLLGGSGLGLASGGLLFGHCGVCVWNN